MRSEKPNEPLSNWWRRQQVKSCSALMSSRIKHTVANRQDGKGQRFVSVVDETSYQIVSEVEEDVMD